MFKPFFVALTATLATPLLACPVVPVNAYSHCESAVQAVAYAPVQYVSAVAQVGHVGHYSQALIGRPRFVAPVRRPVILRQRGFGYGQFNAPFVRPIVRPVIVSPFRQFRSPFASPFASPFRSPFFAPSPFLGIQSRGFSLFLGR